MHCQRDASSAGARTWSLKSRNGWRATRHWCTRFCLASPSMDSANGIVVALWLSYENTVLISIVWCFGILYSISVAVCSLVLLHAATVVRIWPVQFTSCRILLLQMPMKTSDKKLIQQSDESKINALHIFPRLPKALWILESRPKGTTKSLKKVQNYTGFKISRPLEGQQLCGIMYGAIFFWIKPTARGTFTQMPWFGSGTI